MTLSLRQLYVAVILALLLLVSLLGWSLKALTPTTVPHQHSHQVAWYCPPPPKEC